MSEIKHNAYFFNPRPHRPDYPLLIFLPGMDETGKDLMTLQTKSLEIGFDVRCFVIPPEDLDNWDSLAARAIALTKAELPPVSHRPVYLCGESFGACVALKMLEQAPYLFEKIILINPASSFARVRLLDLGSRLFPFTPNLFYSFSAFLSVPFLAPITRLSQEALQDLEQATRSAPKKTAQQRLQLLREFSLDRTRLQQIQQPVLLIGSEKDRLLPSVEEVKRLAEIFPQAEVVTLPHSGHACLVETEINLYQIMETHNFIERSQLSI